MRAFKIMIKIIIIVVIVVVVVVGGYVLYVALNYERIPDNKALTVDGSGNEISLELDKEYSALTFNIGFGAYDHDFSFFMDDGVLADGTEVTGLESRAHSEKAVIDNTNATIADALAENPDILLVQEIDVKANRSYNYNQCDEFVRAFSDRNSGSVDYTYASNFHTAYLFYPPTKPIGKITDSGLLTLSKYKISDAVRRSYPVSDAFPTKFFDLDRCFAVNRMPVSGSSNELVFINTHMSAYDKGGTIRKAQMEMISKVISDEYAAGNWVIVGGDFNHALGDSDTKFMNGMGTPPWVQKFNVDMLPDGFTMLIADNNDTVATCRDTSIVYMDDQYYRVTLDGFIVSDNVDATSHNIDADFVGSDHNPVSLRFTLKK
jgi:endonuclease/exonuclease/phosphatase family metal-dependent hydrolase